MDKSCLWRILYVTCYLFHISFFCFSLFETTYQPNFTFIICIYSLVQPPTRHEHLDDILDIDHLLLLLLLCWIWMCWRKREKRRVKQHIHLRFFNAFHFDFGFSIGKKLILLFVLKWYYDMAGGRLDLAISCFSLSSVSLTHFSFWFDIGIGIRAIGTHYPAMLW